MPAHGSGPDRVVVGFDDSSSSLAALDWAAAHAERTHATLEVVTAWEWPTAYGAPMSFPDGYDPQSDAETLVERAKGIVAAAHPDVTTKAVVVRGHPAPVLVQMSEGASLLVVGSRGHGEFVGMLLGSVSEHCASNAHCPVVVFRDG